MGATVTVSYRRVIQIKSYETQTYELGITDVVPFAAGSPEVEQTAWQLYTRLESVGEALIQQTLRRVA